MKHSRASEVTAIILCGGEARRLGGVEKPLLELDGKPILAHIIDSLSGNADQVIVSANRELAQYRKLINSVVTDKHPGLGPLGGLDTVLPLVKTRYFFCCPGDAPFISGSVVERLLDAFKSDQPTLVYAHDGDRAQHLFLLGLASISNQLNQYLSTGQRSVKGFVAAFNAQAVPMPDLKDSFLNINTATDLSDASGRLSDNNTGTPP